MIDLVIGVNFFGFAFSDVISVFRQQALDNPGDELCEKNADLIKVGLVKLEGDISETLTELRYELVDIDSPA